MEDDPYDLVDPTAPWTIESCTGFGADVSATDVSATDDRAANEQPFGELATRAVFPGAQGPQSRIVRVRRINERHTVSRDDVSRDDVTSDAVTRDDHVACEEPLEIQIGPVSLAVVMRTPGHDEELALGFLLTERIVSAPEEVLSVRHCSTVLSPEAEDNVIRVALAEHVRLDLAALRRNLYASSSCGICGKATIENVLATAPPLRDDTSEFYAANLRLFADELASEQSTFHLTGGLHGAALFDPDGRLLVAREDVGRHNAVDKVIGWAASLNLFPLAGHALMVSGRISYEIVQKALAARIPLVAAVSAPTSLAVELAEASGMTLVGFLRGETMNIYAEQSRVIE